MSSWFGHSKSRKGRPQEINNYETDEPDCVAESGWEFETQPWTATTCKKYVKMKHILKVFPKEQVRASTNSWDVPCSNCQSDHFLYRYHEVTTAAGIVTTKPTKMRYTTMAMVWAEIVLHRDIDWRTITGRDTARMTRDAEFIPTSWNRDSDCHPRWSNRRSDGDVNANLPRQDARHPSPPNREATQQHDHWNDHYNNNPPPTFEAAPYWNDFSGHQYGGSSNSTPVTPPTNMRGYDNPYSNYSSTPNYPHTTFPPKQQYEDYEDYQNTYKRQSYPPPTYSRTRDREEEEYQRQIQEATIRSQEEYIKKLEDDRRFMDRQYDYNPYNPYEYPGGPSSGPGGPSSGPGGPSRRYGSE